MRVRLLLFLAAVLLCWMAGGVHSGAQTQSGTAPADAERKRQFLKAREQMRTEPAATPSATPAAKPKPRTTPAPAPATPRPTVPPAPPITPRPAVRPEAPRVTPVPAPAPAPVAATPAPTPVPVMVTPAPAPAPVVIEKSGLEESQGLQPASAPGWFTRWKFLSRALRQEIDRAPVQKRRWRYIVVHNSGTRQGNAKAFDYYHKYVRKMQNGLAYHFVIGNGTSSGDGEIEVGNRWRRQINGGHVHSDFLNNIALGICLVGDFNRDTVTKQQLLALDELIRYLRQRVGRIDRQWAIVQPHRNINPPRWPTDCPGDKFPYSWLRQKFP